MKQFFKILLASLLALILFFGFFIVIMIGIVASSASSSNKVTAVLPNSVLKLRLSGQLKERADVDPLQEFGIKSSSMNTAMGLVEIKKALKRAKEDPNIKAVYIEEPMLFAGPAMIQEVRNAILDFKKSKKPVIAYSEFYTEGGYYIASAADKVYLNPNGNLEFNGLSSTPMFLKGMFEKLEIKPEIFRVGEFKSAVEPFMNDKMSDANRLQVTAYLNSLYNNMLKDIASSRKLDYDTLKMLSNKMKVREPEDAVANKLITRLVYFDEVEAELKKLTGKKGEEDKVEWVTLNNYIKNVEENEEVEISDNKIAVIIAEGEIQGAKASSDNIGSDKMVAEIKKARLDKKVKAIVLRINSPGGSAVASDIMWREIQLAKKAKPVIASMSSVAASGGYYLAMGADKIVAMPTTITGSIGVFGVMFYTQKLFNNKLGITFDRVTTGEMSDFGNPMRPLTDAERSIIQSSVNKIYNDFTTKAAEGRKMSVEKLRAVASGRVWTGEHAKEIGLIDEFGGLEDAIAIAAKTAKVGKDYKVRYYPAKKNVFEMILEDIGEEAASRLIAKQFGEYEEMYKQMNNIKSKSGVQAWLPIDVRSIN